MEKNKGPYLLRKPCVFGFFRTETIHREVKQWIHTKKKQKQPSQRFKRFTVGLFFPAKRKDYRRRKKSLIKAVGKSSCQELVPASCPETVNELRGAA
jgi:hypothetical protein